MHDVLDFGRVLDVSSEAICRELILYSRLSLPLGHWLPEDLTILRSLTVGLMTTLEIPVLAFQETDVYDIHRAGVLALDSFETSQAGMSVFGYRLLGSTCMVR